MAQSALDEVLAGLPPGAEPVVETTGEPVAVEAALRDAPDLGIVVLAGPVPDRPPPVDLYGDLHVRGLTVVCVPPAHDIP
ncbi:MAG TPA: hypothetical protein VF072_05785 [Thermoleophilaceae bacterium]